MKKLSYPIFLTSCICILYGISMEVVYPIFTKFPTFGFFGQVSLWFYRSVYGLPDALVLFTPVFIILCKDIFDFKRRDRALIVFVAMGYILFLCYIIKPIIFGETISLWRSQYYGHAYKWGDVGDDLPIRYRTIFDYFKFREVVYITEILKNIQAPFSQFLVLILLLARRGGSGGHRMVIGYTLLTIFVWSPLVSGIEKYSPEKIRDYLYMISLMSFPVFVYSLFQTYRLKKYF